MPDNWTQIWICERFHSRRRSATTVGYVLVCFVSLFPNVLYSCISRFLSLWETGVQGNKQTYCCGKADTPVVPRCLVSRSTYGIVVVGRCTKHVLIQRAVGASCVFGFLILSLVQSLLMLLISTQHRIFHSCCVCCFSFTIY